MPDVSVGLSSGVWSQNFFKRSVSLEDSPLCCLCNKSILKVRGGKASLIYCSMILFFQCIRCASGCCCFCLWCCLWCCLWWRWGHQPFHYSQWITIFSIISLLNFNIKYAVLINLLRIDSKISLLIQTKWKPKVVERIMQLWLKSLQLNIAMLTFRVHTLHII